MYGSPALSDELKLAFPLESDVRGRQMAHGGLVRLRSAPSSLIGEACDEFIPAARPSSPDSLLARFFSSDIHQHDKPTPPSAGEQPPPTSASSVVDHGGTDLVSSQQQQQLMFYGSHGAQASRLSLARQCSSPAGFFSPLNAEIGYGAMKGVSEAALHPGRLHHQLSFSSRQSSLMSQISEIDTKRMRGSSPDETKPGNGNSGSCYIPGFIVGSCDDSSMLCDNSSGLKRVREDADENIIAGLLQTDAQNRNVRNRVPGLSHQVSFPKASSEIAAMEKFLQFQDAVPCKVRAKRGCATHPRSIAERVRRTRISERMRKLQEVVPNMDKQTNTADMLDLAVEHIKNLQKQVKLLSHDRATCACASSKQQLHSSPSV